MIAVDQTLFGDGSDGSEPGNCLAACIASLLELPLSGLPNFAVDGGDGRWFIAANQWLAERGFAFLELFWENGVPRESFKFGPSRLVWHDQLFLAGGPADRGFGHWVIMRGVKPELAHDPHPSRAGLLKIESLAYLIPHDSARIPCRG